MTDSAPKRVRNEFWRQRARRAAAHIVLASSKETGIPVSAAVQQILDEEAQENAKSA
ncbi:hypothetical protein [Tsukamurella pseudospumae]|uniref:hypothetical protein n=1 Tax=Tsukamurella pseudospumae TaxID=239498 RepID=UPI000AC52A67|nr:hypothetical protein [Tsukamurella pseudospumae]